MTKTATSTVDAWRVRQVLPSSRRITQWTFAAVRLALLLSSLFLVLWVVNYNPVTWDLTQERLFSISDQTEAVLETLQEPITLTAFVRGGKDAGIERVLLAYGDASRRIDTRLVDLEAEPALAAEYQVREYNTLIVVGAERVQRAGKIEEPEITNAILAVTRGEPVPVCFLAGHGERNPGDKEREGFSAASTALSQTNYEVRNLNLGVEGAVPDDCRVVVIAGPSTDILVPERQALAEFVDNGGRLMVLFESRTDVPELAALMALYGLSANPDFIIDTRRNGQQFGLGIQVPLVDEYQEHPITHGFRPMTLYNMPRSITVAEPTPEGIDARPLASSTVSSWGETRFERGVGATYDPEQDLAGPLPIVVAVATRVEETPRTYRDRMRKGDPAPVGEPLLVAAGDADFASNALFGWQGNGDLFLNSVNWLAGQQELISIRPKEIANKRVLLTNGRRALTFALLVILLPMLPAVIGVVMMIKKVE